MDDNDAYFQSGYVLLTGLIKQYLGYSPYYLVTTVFVLVMTSICYACRILHKGLCINGGYTVKSCNYIFTFLTIWSVYYGFSSCAEGLRPGISFSILYLSMIFAINRKWVASILFAFISGFIHTQAVIFLPGMALLFFIDTISPKVIRIWFITNIVLGLLIGLFGIFDFSLLEFLFNTMDSYGDASHYEGYLSANETKFISTQWVTKQLVAFLLLFGNHENKLYNRATILYYFGLSIAAIMSASTIFLRFEGAYIPSFLFAFYYFLRDNSFSKTKRIAILALYIPYFGTMLLRFLGTYI